MSSVSAPFGMRVAYHPSGTYRPEKGTINAAAAAIYSGDPVTLQADGTIARATAGAGNKIIGVFDGCTYRDITGKPNVSKMWPADPNATDIVCYYIPDQEVIYEIQANGPVSQSAIGEQAAVILGSGSNMIGQSGAMLNTATLSNTVENQFAVIGIREYPDNVWGDAFTVVLVKIAQHQRAAQFDAY